MLGAFARKCLCRALTGRREIVLDNKVPTREELSRRYEDIEEWGIYLHIPFCR